MLVQLSMYVLSDCKSDPFLYCSYIKNDSIQTIKIVHNKMESPNDKIENELEHLNEYIEHNSGDKQLTIKIAIKLI